MQIVFMGTPDFAVHSLLALIGAGYEITGVVTQPDRPSGRKMEIKTGPVAAVAKEYELPLYQPEKIRNNPEAVETIRGMKPDLIVVAAFGQIIPKEILESRTTRRAGASSRRSLRPARRFSSTRSRS